MVLSYAQNIERISEIVSLIKCFCYIILIELKVKEVKFGHEKLSFKVSSMDVLELTWLS